MILLRLISWPHLRKHVVRSLLTTAGIVLGVAVFAAMHTANRTVLVGFARTVDRIAGKTQLQVSVGEAGFGEEILEVVQSAPAVRVAVPILEVVVDSQIKGEGSLLVLGVDMTGDRSLRDYDLEHDNDDNDGLDDPLIFLAQPDSIMISKEFADRNRIAMGSQLSLGTTAGPRLFTVRGIMKSQGLASAFAGSIVVMDIYAAQHMFGRGRTFDRIDVGLKDGVHLTDGQQQLRALVGPGFDVQPPSSRGQQFESIMASYSLLMGMSSAFALFIGMFIIYNSFSIAVSERRQEIGILRALGATTGQVRWIFLGEGALLGAVGSLLGLGVGMLLARAIAYAAGNLINDVYRIGQILDDVVVDPSVLGWSFAAGMAISVLAAVVPARRAARLDPVEAMQWGAVEKMATGFGRWRAGLVVFLLLLAVVTLVVPGTPRSWFYTGYMSAMIAALLLVPMLTVGLARLARPILRSFYPIEGALAADSLIQAPRRTSATVAALMFSLALAVSFEGITLSNTSSIVEWMYKIVNPDLFVLPSQSLDVRAARFPASVVTDVAAVPGVSRVQPVRNGRTTFRGAPVMVLALDMRSFGETVTARPIAGDSSAMYRLAAAGEGVIVSDNFAQLKGLRLGDTLELAAPYGLIRLPIVGALVDYSDQQGTIMMDRSVFVRYWRDDSVNVLRVFTSPGESPMVVRRRILEHLGGKRQMFVMTNAEAQAYIMKVIGQWSSMTSIQTAVALLVAVLGIVNALTVSIKDRRRELGVLRAVGALHWQVRRTIWMEAVAIGAFGLVLGIAFGALNLTYLLDVVHRDVAGMRLIYEFPVGAALLVAPVVLGAAFLGALWPAELAVRGSVVEALVHE